MKTFIMSAIMQLFILQIATLFAQGWPQTIYGEPNTWIGSVSPVVADLDNDGTKELVVTTQGNSVGHLSTLFIFEASGDLRTRVDADYYFDPRGFPSIGDIDNDNEMEILIEADGQILIYDSQGNLEQNLPVAFQMSDDLFGAIVLADVNRDSTLEIIYGGWHISGSRLVVLDGNGNNAPGFPVVLENSGTSQTTTPAVGNLDGDDDWEIVIISYLNNSPDSTNIRAFNTDGSLLWSQKILPVSYSDPVIGDVNNDGFNEVIVTAADGVYILDSTGNVVLNLPLGQDMDHSNVALADLDADNDLEIVFEYGFRLYAMHDDGTVIFCDSSTWVVLNPPVIGDINDDGFPDIIINSEDSIYALNASGVILDGFPKPLTPISWYTYPSIEDIDNDGNVDVISSSSWIEPTIATGIIYVWELAAGYDESAMPWSMYQHDPQHTGYYHHSAPGGISGEPGVMCQSVLLSQNYPNPVNSSTTISFSLSSRSYVSVKIFDCLGRHVATLLSADIQPGDHSLEWNPCDLEGGVYFCRLQAGTFTETKKLVLTK